MNKKFTIVLTIVALLFIGGLVISNSTPDQPVEQTAPVAQTVGRLDISTKPYTEDAQFILYREDKESPLDEATWMKEYNMRGYMLQTEGEGDIFTIAPKKDLTINLALRGKWERDANNENIKHWVDYTSVKANGEELLPETIAVWHDKPFELLLDVEAGKTYTIDVKWKAHTDNREQ